MNQRSNAAFCLASCSRAVSKDSRKNATHHYHAQLSMQCGGDIAGVLLNVSLHM